jgi:hypothetical protein
MWGMSISIQEPVEDGHSCSEDVCQDEPWFCGARSDVMPGGGEKFEVGVTTAAPKSVLSTGVNSSRSKTEPSLEETSSASGRTKLRFARSRFKGESLRRRSVGVGKLETDDSSMASS